MPYYWPNWAKICCVTLCGLWSNKDQKGHIMCQAHFKSKIHFFGENLGVENSDSIFPIFSKNNDPLGHWDPSYSIPGEKLTHLHVKTTILAQKLWILEFFWRGRQKKVGSLGSPWGVRPKKTFGNHYSCIFRKSQWVWGPPKPIKPILKQIFDGGV